MPTAPNGHTETTFPGPTGDAVNLPNHYARFKIEPIRFIGDNELNWFQGNIIKYILRWDAKDGRQDIRKASRYLAMWQRFLDKDPDWWKASRDDAALIDKLQADLAKTLAENIKLQEEIKRFRLGVSYGASGKTLPCPEVIKTVNRAAVFTDPDGKWRSAFDRKLVDDHVEASKARKDLAASDVWDKDDGDSSDA